MSEITLYTDGACDHHAPNRPGGWAAILVARDGKGRVVKELPLQGGEENTTNNRMELMAIIKGLEALKQPSIVTVVTDSKYVAETMTNNQKRRVNHDLWQRLDELCSIHEVHWQHVYGHTGHEYNERCDKMAVAEKHKFRLDKVQENAPDTPVKIYISAKSLQTGLAGWGAVIVENDTATEYSERIKANSDNQASLMAIVSLVESRNLDDPIAVFTNNEYLINGITRWIQGWIRKGWVNQSKEPVKYRKLWQKLYDFTQSHTVHWQFMNRKSGNSYFTEADNLAWEAAKE